MAAVEEWFEKNTTDEEKASLARIRAPAPHLKSRSTPEQAPLGDIVRFLERFVAFPQSVQARAVALWIVHAHAIGCADTTARLAIQSAEKQSGKTRLLEVIEMLVPNPLSVAHITPAAMFRKIRKGQVTVLIDEVDAIFNVKANNGNEDLRALLNAGYRKGATVARCVGDGKKTDVEEFPVFAPVALAGIGSLPDTLQDRSIVVRLKRRARDEFVEKLRRRLVVPDAERLRTNIAAWVADHHDALASAIPDVPDELPDRAVDIWEPLFAIADLVGGKWPERARTAALRLSCPTDDAAQHSERVRLLADVRSVFDETEVDRLASADLAAALHKLDESPWAESWFDTRKLAAKLRPFDIRPKVVRSCSDVFRGYLRCDLEDAFSRYLENTVTCVTPVTEQASTDAGCNRVTDVTVFPEFGEFDGLDLAHRRAAEAAERRRARERARQRAADGLEQ